MSHRRVFGPATCSGDQGLSSMPLCVTGRRVGRVVMNPHEATDETRTLSAALLVLKALDCEPPVLEDVMTAMSEIPELGERLVHLARSPMFGITADDLTAQRAIVLIGFSSVRSMTVLHAAESVATGDFSPAYWDLALLTGITTQQLALRAGEKANDGLLAGMLNRWIVETGSAMDQSLTESLSEPVVEAIQVGDIAWIDDTAPILCRLVAAGRMVADMMVDRSPGIPSVVALTDLLETSPCPGLADPRLATDIRRGVDMFHVLDD